jgi:glycosyltransferase involved in cell wall biosynthesis
MKNITVWVFQTGEPVHSDGGNPRPMRAMNLTNALTAAGHNVVLWTSSFFHQEKCQRRIIGNRLKISDKLEIRYIDSPGYKRNIGIERLFDHWILGRNLEIALRSESIPPDVAFIGYPPIETAAVMGKWLHKRGVPFLLDVKDLWPSVFLEAFPKALRSIGRVALEPYFRLAKWSVSQATGVSTMANSFLENILILASRKRGNTDGVFYLTSPKQMGSSEELLDASAWWDKLGVFKEDGKCRICYIGNLSPNVDLMPIREAAIFFQKNNAPVEFVICGNGVSYDEFVQLMVGLSNVKFPGRINRSKIEVLAQRSSAALIPYVNNENFQLSLPNKAIDSMSLGLPILSPLQGEVAEMLKKFNVGMRYGTDSGQDIVMCIERLVSEPVVRDQMSKNASLLYENEFSFDAVYGGLVSHLVMLSNLKHGPKS